MNIEWLKVQSLVLTMADMILLLTPLLLFCSFALLLFCSFAVLEGRRKQDPSSLCGIAVAKLVVEVLAKFLQDWRTNLGELHFSRVSLLESTCNGKGKCHHGKFLRRRV